MPASYVGGGTATNVAFSGLTSATNTSAAMVVGTGASLSATGTGAITATTNANLTGAVTSVGNATSFAASPTFTGTSTFSGPVSVTAQVAASVSPVSLVNGTWTVGSGTGTTTVPQLYINGGAAAPTTLSTSGTAFGINAPSGFAGSLIDFRINGGGSIANMNTLGRLTCGGIATGALITSSFAGAASSAVITTTAAPLASGTGTTNFPQWFANWGGTAVTNWSNGTNNGTVFGVNAAAAFTGNFFDCHVSSNTSVFQVTATGAMTVGSSITTGTPNGGTAGAWKFGILVTTTVVFDTSRYIQLDVGGTLYKVGVCV